MHTRRSLIIAGLCLAVALVIVGTVLYLRSVDFSAYRSVVVSRLERVTGRDVEIKGDFDVTLSLTPTLVAEVVTLGNAPWGSRDAMVRVERIEMDIQLIPLLLDGDVRVDRLVIARPDIVLETDAEGNGNWEFHQGRVPDPSAEASEQGEFLLEDVTVVDGTVIRRGPDADAVDPLRIDRFTWQADDVTSRLSLSGVGAYRSLPLELEGTVGSIANLLRESNPYPLDLRIETGDIAATVRGQLGADPEGGDFAIEVDATGGNIAPLGTLADIALPPFGPFEAHVELINKDEQVSAREIQVTAGDLQSTLLRIQGRIAAVTAGEGVDLRLSAEGADLQDLAALAEIDLSSFGPYRIETRLTNQGGDLALTDFIGTAGTEASRIEAAGAIRQPLEAEGLDLSVTAEGTTLAALSPLVGMDLPDLGPYRLDGRLTDPGDTYQVEEMDARIGRSHLGGHLLVALPADDGVRIEGTLSSERLDLGPFLEAGSTPTDAQANPDRVFSDEPFDPAFLRAADADLTLRAALVTFAETELRDVALDMTLEQGRLTIEPFVFQVADGRADGRLMLDAGTAPLRIATRFEAERVDVAKLLDRFVASENVSGRAGVTLDLTSVGQSPHALMAALDGSALLIMRNGRVVGTQLHRLVTDLDLLNLLPAFWDWNSDDAVEIVCMVGQAAIDAGRARTKILLDTKRMTMVGTGVVDFGAETLDLELVPEAKSSKLSTVAVPVDIEGRFTDIEVKPQTDVAVGRGVTGLVGGLLVPLNLFASLVGDDADSACVEAIHAGGELPEDEPPESAEADSDKPTRRQR
ncbi:AsmA family protein [Rhodospirillaceae bacterium SYSU D60014]|uniref:AsmA family protein n=1 Tax=Virgifigura deserti TaxID=2268457 RepID=UPI000E66E94F